MTGGPFAPSERGGVPADKVRLAPVSKLHGWDRNPRTITPARLKDLARDLEADPGMLWARPLVAREDGTVLMGNQRLAAARALGWTHLPVAFVTVDDEVATLRAIRDNVPYGAWESEGLADMLLELPEASRHLAGLDTSALQAALALGKYPSLDRDDDPIPQAPAEPVTKPGDVVELGRHRLVCGDATDPEVWQALLEGVKAAPMLSVTDPPYGVSWDVGTTTTARPEARRPNLGVMAGDAGGLEAAMIWTRWLHLAADNMAPNSTIYTFGPLSQLDALVQVGHAMLESRWRLGAPLVWDRGYMGLGRFTWRHRCELAWELHQGDGAAWLPGQGIDNLLSGHQSGPYARARDPEAYEHPTPKPTTLMQQLVQTRQGDVVIDPFAGSGSVLIACERLERRALLIEIDPGFCDLIRRRWEGLGRGGA